MDKNYSVLLIEDDRVDQLAFKRFIEQSDLNYNFEVVSSFREAKQVLTTRQFDVVITDYFLGDGTAFDIFQYISDSSIIITTGTGDEEIAVRAMKCGAYDYLIKDRDRNYLTVLPITVENALKQKKAVENQKRLSLLESAVLHGFDAVMIVESWTTKLENTKIVYVNNAFTKLTGYEPEEMLGKSLNYLYGQQLTEDFLVQMSCSFLGKKALFTELVYFNKIRTKIWVELTMQPVANGSGKSDHWVIVQKDITSRKRAENELRQNNERLDMILQSMGDGVIVIDENQKIMIMNNKAIALLENSDWQNGDCLLKNVLTNCKQSGKTLLQALKRKSFSNLELQVEKPQTRVLLVTGSSFLDVDGISGGKVLMLRDFTKEKEIEQLKTDFVSNVSHELRTPLASIMGFSSTIQKDKNMPPETREEFNEIIYKESARLTQLIEDILSISKIESGKSIYEAKELDLEKIIYEVQETFKLQAKEKNIKIVEKISKGVPSIFADTKAMRQVIVNLLGNAIKFTESGGAITISLTSKNHKVGLEINDTGIGIPKKDINRIFDKFFRVYREKNNIPGTGLGLSIVKEIVNFHKGQIEVFSEENKGTTFRVIFPVYEKEK